MMRGICNKKTGVIAGFFIISRLAKKIGHSGLQRNHNRVNLVT